MMNSMINTKCIKCNEISHITKNVVLNIKQIGIFIDYKNKKMIRIYECPNCRKLYIKYSIYNEKIILEYVTKQELTKYGIYVYE